MTTATLAGLRATHARLAIPAWGMAFADVSIDGEDQLSGRVELKIADLTYSMTVLSGGPSTGRASYRLVGGAGGWGKTIPAGAYANDAGVKLSTILQDAAKLAGETLDASTVPTSKVGPAFVREQGPAARSLQLFADENWYVDETGATKIGRRVAADLKTKATIGVIDRARGMVPIAADSIASILPGVRVEGIEALDVLHEVTPKNLRSTIWGGANLASTNPRITALRSLIEQLLPDLRYRGGPFEYRVVTLDGNRLNLQPVRVSLGMPDLRRVPMRPGVAGANATVALGSVVLVAFVNNDAARPAVVGFEDPDGEGFVPTLLELADAGGRTIRDGELVSVVGPATLGSGIAIGTISIHPSITTPGAPGVGFSRVKT